MNVSGRYKSPGPEDEVNPAGAAATGRLWVKDVSFQQGCGQGSNEDARL